MGRMAEASERDRKMIIIEVAGGLGNQMFQYALYQKYLHMGKPAKLDLFSYENPKSMPFELDLFRLPYEIDTKKERNGYTDQKRLIITGLQIRCLENQNVYIIVKNWMSDINRRFLILKMAI